MNDFRFMLKNKFAFLLSLLMFSPLAYGQRGPTLLSVKHPDWCRNQVIYEVNIRQYTPEGTFKAFEQHLPRLKEMGAGILWLMPINPIGMQNRKGSLGSYYSVRDYLAVNPEFGTMDDFKSLVEKIHAAGMYVIIDWVANHCAWDNELALVHPDWFTLDSTGNFMPPVKDWADVIDLNYDKPEVHAYMRDAMKYWVKETHIDGFRCDVAGMIPIEFWNETRAALDSIKPVFMLAEDEKPDLHFRAFDMSYGWEFMHLCNAIAKGEKTAKQLEAYFSKDSRNYPQDSYRMYFTSNHDENSWNGTEFERLGDGAKAFAVLSFTVPGVPLIYSGQETGLNRRLKFFDKDTIEWKESEFGSFYKSLADLKHKSALLHNGILGGRLIKLSSNQEKSVFGFMRVALQEKLIVLTNLSKDPLKVTLQSNLMTGDYKDYFSNEKVTLTSKWETELPAWGYRVFVKN